MTSFIIVLGSCCVFQAFVNCKDIETAVRNLLGCIGRNRNVQVVTLNIIIVIEGVGVIFWLHFLGGPIHNV